MKLGRRRGPLRGRDQKGSVGGVCVCGGGVLGSIVMMESNSILLHAEYSPGGLFPLPEHSRMVESFSLAQAA